MPKKSRRIYIYGTVFNNATTVERAIQSIIPLKPLKIFIVDKSLFHSSFMLCSRMFPSLKSVIQE